MWIIVGGVGLAVLVLGAAFLLGERKRGARIFEEARNRESGGDFPGACYCYAIAASAGHQRRSCEDQIRVLWERHGPFDFHEQLVETVKEYCDYESCGEGFHEMTVDCIRGIVGAKTDNAT
jgi:hypothetical protein